MPDLPLLLLIDRLRAAAQRARRAPEALLLAEAADALEQLLHASPQRVDRSLEISPSRFTHPKDTSYV